MVENNSDQNEKAADSKNIWPRLLIVAGIFLGALSLFWMIADEMVLEKENAIDSVIFQQLSHITNPSTTSAMVTITFFGSPYFLFPAYSVLVLYFFFHKKNRKLSFNIIAIGLIGTVILFTLKSIFKRHRPPDPLLSQVEGFSFPSGHSFSSFTFFGLLIYILWRLPVNPAVRWFLSVLFFLFALAIAFSRVYLHVHYASDVIAGFFLCVTWLTLSFWLLEKINPAEYH